VSTEVTSLGTLKGYVSCNVPYHQDQVAEGKEDECGDEESLLALKLGVGLTKNLVHQIEQPPVEDQQLHEKQGKADDVRDLECSVVKKQNCDDVPNDDKHPEHQQDEEVDVLAVEFVILLESVKIDGGQVENELAQVLRVADTCRY